MSAPSARTTAQSWRRKSLALGAGVLATLALGAGEPAQAATDAEWNRLANCESGGNWGINTGNGYYGGLQFSKASWDWAGGTQYAAYPHQATRAEQVKTAERLLDRQDVRNAWPACSSKLGLTQRQMQSGSPGGGADDGSGDTGRTGGDNNTGNNNSGDDSRAATGRTHRVRSGDTLSSVAKQYGVAGGWQVLYEANRDRVSNPNVVRVGQVLRIPGGSASSDGSNNTGDQATPQPKPAPSPSGDTYRVRRGDTLARIAARLDVNGGWQALYRANNDRLANANVIQVGQVLRVPGGSTDAPADNQQPTQPTQSADTHRVRSGETLSAIAKRHGVTGGWQALYRANNDRLSSPHVLQVGQRLHIPG